jgi:predicted nucleic acid-binding protein
VKRYVFDTGALALYFDGDPAVRRHLREVDRGAAEGLVTDLCLTELQYKVCETKGTREAEVDGRTLRASRLRIVRSGPFLDGAWRLKCRYRQRFSLVDCVNLAVAQVNPSRILTTDGAYDGLREPRVSVRVFPVSR